MSTYFCTLRYLIVLFLTAYPGPGSTSKLRSHGRPRRLPNNGARPSLRVLVDTTRSILDPLHVVRAPQPGTRQIRVHVQHLQIARGDALPLHRVRRFRLVRALPRERGSPAQDGEAGTRPRRGLVTGRHEAGQPTGGAQTVHSALHPVAGARVPVPRRQLPSAFVPEDEACGTTHQDLQTQDQGRLPHLQAADRTVLLPRKALPGDEVLGAVLQQHQAEVKAAASAAASAAATIVTPAHGRHEHARRGARCLFAARAAACQPSAFQAASARAASQRAEGAATGRVLLRYYQVTIGTFTVVKLISCATRAYNPLI